MGEGLCWTCEKHALVRKISQMPSKFSALFFILFLSSCQTLKNQADLKNVHEEQAAIPSENLNAGLQPKIPKTYSFAFVGDVIIHERLRTREEKKREGYKVIWSEIQKYLDQADLSYANLEGPVAPDLGKPSGFPQFNFPEKILPSLKESGFDVVSTANNHSLDKGAKGVRSTIKHLKKHKISYTGTVSSVKALEQKKETWWYVSKVGQKKVAWISCTEMTNGIKDKENLVLYCFKDIEKVKTAIQTLKERSDISAIILMPHWGEEEEYEIESYRKRWAHVMLNLGASAIVGSHPHVVQKIENFTTEDGRSTVIAYSLGNFVSNQYWLWTKTSMLLFLKFKEDISSEQLLVDDVKYIPLWMNRTIEKDGTAKFRVLPIFDFKKVPYDASQIWIQQLGNEKRLKEPDEVEHFLKPSFKQSNNN